MFFYMRLEKHLCNSMSRVLLIHEDFEIVFGGGGGRGKWEGGRALDVWILGSFEKHLVYISLVCMYCQRRNLDEL